MEKEENEVKEKEMKYVSRKWILTIWCMALATLGLCATVVCAYTKAELPSGFMAVVGTLCGTGIAYIGGNVVQKFAPPKEEQ